MIRQIVTFVQDEESDWVAYLDCGHRQHVRHRPPFFERPWVVAKESRDEKIGSELDCVLCDRLEFPDNLVSYHRTPEFDSTTTPAKLRSDHVTKRGVWGRIVVLDGSISYTVQSQRYLLTPDKPGVVVPMVPHFVTPHDDSRFYVEFLRPQFPEEEAAE